MTLPPLDELYRGFVSANQHFEAHSGGPVLGGAMCVAGLPVAIEALELDPVSGRLFLAFVNPYKLLKRTRHSLDVNDGTVASARLDLDARSLPLALEIKPKAAC